MQILGKRSKVLLFTVAIVMLVTAGVSFALWDMSAVKAITGNIAYSTAQVGDIIQYGRYYQTGLIGEDGEYEKTPIDWLVVDKDERTGQITLMSKYILACGSFFGNWYYDESGVGDFHYDKTLSEVGGNSFNQAYVDSTVRSYLNNLERLDLGGDGFTSGIGYIPSKTNSTVTSGLLSNVGYSNEKYWTGLYASTEADKLLVDAGNKGLLKRYENNEIYYQRPISNLEYRNRPATRGFYDEAFNKDEKTKIVPKTIAGNLAHRWPDNNHDISTKSNVEGCIDKIWIPSATELNVKNGLDWNNQTDDSWTSPSDETGDSVFEYFMNFEGDELSNALKAMRTAFAKNSFAMNYSIPVYNKLGNDEKILTVNTNIDTSKNSADHYWLRSPSSPWYHSVRAIISSGKFNSFSTRTSNIGVRPCIILKY